MHVYTKAHSDVIKQPTVYFSCACENETLHIKQKRKCSTSVATRVTRCRWFDIFVGNRHDTKAAPKTANILNYPDPSFSSYYTKESKLSQTKLATTVLSWFLCETHNSLDQNYQEKVLR